MNKAVLVNANINKGSKGCYVCNYSRDCHPRYKVVHVMNCFIKGKPAKLFPWIKSWICNLFYNIFKGRHTHSLCQVTGQINFFNGLCVHHKLFNAKAGIFCHFLYNFIGFRMNTGSVKCSICITDS